MTQKERIEIRGKYWAINNMKPGVVDSAQASAGRYLKKKKELSREILNIEWKKESVKNGNYFSVPEK